MLVRSLQSSLQGNSIWDRRPLPCRFSLSRRDFLRTATAALGVTGVLAACAVPTGETAEGAAESAELSVWVWWPSPVPSLIEMGDTFMEAHPNVTVSVEAPSDYWTKVQTSIAGGAGPDSVLHEQRQLLVLGAPGRAVRHDRTGSRRRRHAGQHRQLLAGSRRFLQLQGPAVRHALHVHVHRPLLQRGLHRQQGVGPAGGH